MGYSERSIWVANCPSQPPNSVLAPISAPEHMVLFAPLAPIHCLFKSEFQFQAKNIRSRKTEGQQTKLQICYLLLHPISARLVLPREGHRIAGRQGDRTTPTSVQGLNCSINFCKASPAPCSALASALRQEPGSSKICREPEA